jgi:hypothetical protein
VSEQDGVLLIFACAASVFIFGIVLPAVVDAWLSYKWQKVADTPRSIDSPSKKS